MSAENQRRRDPSVAPLRLVAWETTRACNLRCVHCRAQAADRPLPGELSTEEGLALIDEIASFGPVVLILTGGEPLLRSDIVELARGGSEAGLRVVMAPNGTLLTPERARQLVAAGVKRVSISLDGATAEVHDAFRGMPGAYAGALNGMESARSAGLPFQINTTVTKKNLGELDAIFRLARERGAVGVHVFLLVPTGRGADIEETQITPAEYERTLGWIEEKSRELPIEIKTTCAPPYNRVFVQRVRRREGDEAARRALTESRSIGCMGGQQFAFVSSTGTLSPCGYLELDCGSVHREGFREAWLHNPIFAALRRREDYHGKCGVCEYRDVCGGCRARAYAATGDYLAEEPCCVYRPAACH